MRESDVARWEKDKSGRRWNALDASGVLIGSVIFGCGYWRPHFRQVDGAIRACDGESSFSRAQRVVELSAHSPASVFAELRIPADYSSESHKIATEAARLLVEAINEASTTMGLSDIVDKSRVRVFHSAWAKNLEFNAQLPRPDGVDGWEDIYRSTVSTALSSGVFGTTSHSQEFKIAEVAAPAHAVR